MDETTLGIIHRGKRSLAEMLLVDIETAQLILRSGSAKRAIERRKTSRDTAVRAYSMITKYLETDRLLPADKLLVRRRLEPLRHCLISLGEIEARSE